MNEIFYKVPESKYSDGVFLEEYKGVFKLIAGNTGRDGTNYKKWAFPQNKDRKPTEKATPVSVNLGPRYTAIGILKKMIAELENPHADFFAAKKEPAVKGFAEPWNQPDDDLSF